MGHPNLGRWLSRIPNETLVVWGDKDRMMPASQAPIWAERIPNARMLIVARRRPFRHAGRPEDGDRDRRLPRGLITKVLEQRAGCRHSRRGSRHPKEETP